MALLFLVVRSPKIDDELHTQTLEQRQIAIGGLPEVSAAVQNATTHSTSVRSGTTAEVAKVDHLFEAGIAHNSPLS